MRILFIFVLSLTWANRWIDRRKLQWLEKGNVCPESETIFEYSSNFIYIMDCLTLCRQTAHCGGLTLLKTRTYKVCYLKKGLVCKEPAFKEPFGVDKMGNTTKINGFYITGYFVP